MTREVKQANHVPGSNALVILLNPLIESICKDIYKVFMRLSPCGAHIVAL